MCCRILYEVSLLTCYRSKLKSENWGGYVHSKLVRIQISTPHGTFVTCYNWNNISPCAIGFSTRYPYSPVLSRNIVKSLNEATLLIVMEQLYSLSTRAKGHPVYQYVCVSDGIARTHARVVSIANYLPRPRHGLFFDMCQIAMVKWYPATPYGKTMPPRVSPPYLGVRPSPILLMY